MRAVDDVTNDSWQKALSFYDSLSGADWEHIREFRALVSAIAASDEARGLTAITSHEVLILSPYSRHPDWFEGRRLELQPLVDGNIRIVRHSVRPPDSWTLPPDQALREVLALLAEL